MPAQPQALSLAWRGWGAESVPRKNFGLPEVAAARSLSPDELEDRTAPDLGLDDQGTLLLDFGPRAFRVGFDEHLVPFVRTAEGERLAALPRPTKADDAAKAVFARKKNLRLLLTGGVPDPASPGMLVKSVAGGFLAQTRDAGRVTPDALRVVTRRAPTEAELADLLFAFRVCKHVKSNAIVYAKGLATAGIGAGQMNRVESSRIAAWKAEAASQAAGLPESLAKGSVVASDAFFPFADGLETAAAAGATAVIQPGGSIRDAEVIAAADAAGLAMVFTGMRHFRH